MIQDINEKNVVNSHSHSHSHLHSHAEYEPLRVVRINPSRTTYHCLAGSYVFDACRDGEEVNVLCTIGMDRM